MSCPQHGERLSFGNDLDGHCPEIPQGAAVIGQNREALRGLAEPYLVASFLKQEIRQKSAALRVQLFRMV